MPSLGRLKDAGLSRIAPWKMAETMNPVAMRGVANCSNLKQPSPASRSGGFLPRYGVVTNCARCIPPTQLGRRRLAFRSLGFLPHQGRVVPELRAIDVQICRASPFANQTARCGTIPHRWVSTSQSSTIHLPPSQWSGFHLSFFMLVPLVVLRLLPHWECFTSPSYRTVFSWLLTTVAVLVASSRKVNLSP